MNYDLAMMALDGLMRSPLRVSATAGEVVIEGDGPSFKELARLCLLLGGAHSVDDAFELQQGTHVTSESPALRLRLDDGSLAEGVVDLAFREEKRKKGTWTVVDFKTDVELAGRAEAYERQVRLYARAIAAATGEAAVGVLLSV